MLAVTVILAEIEEAKKLDGERSISCNFVTEIELLAVKEHFTDVLGDAVELIVDEFDRNKIS